MLVHRSASYHNGNRLVKSKVSTVADDFAEMGEQISAMVTRIGPKRPFRLYIAEWRKERGLTQDQLAERMNTTKATISRYERGGRKVGADALAALNEALQADVRRDPKMPSADEMLRKAPREVQERAIEVLRAMLGQKAS